MTTRSNPYGRIEEIVEAAVTELRQVAGPVFSAMERSGLPMIATNPRLPDNPIVFVNEAFCRTTGYSAEEAVGRNCRFLQPPGADEEALLQIREAVESGRAISIKLLNQRRDGSHFWNHLFITPVNDDNGEPLFFLSTQVDITQTHLAEEMQAALQVRQKQLDQVNQRLRQTLTLAGTGGSWDWDIPNQRFTADARFAELHGLDPLEAARGVPPEAFFASIHPEDRMRIRLGVAGILNGAEIFSKEYRLLASDGSVHWVHARGRCHFVDDDRPVRFTGAVLEITEQKHIEERLRIAQSAGGIGTFEYVDSFATVGVSEEFCRLLGLHATDVLPVRTINALVVPGDRPIVEQNSGSEGPAYAECRIRRADNGELRWLARRGEYVRDTDTTGLRFIGVIYDISAAKQSEERLRELNEKLESRVEERTRERDRLWSLSSDLFSVCDSDSNLKAVNPAWADLLGYRDNEVVGTPLEAWIHPEDRFARQHLLEMLRRGEPIKDFDVRIRAKDGGYHWISWTFAPAGEVFYSVGRDVTQRKQLEEQLRQSQKMEAVGQLTGGIAHDFNNLLTGIVGSLDLLQKRMAQGRPESFERYIQAATTSANRAAALTHRLLAFARRQPLDPRPVDVNRLVMSMEDLLRRTTSEAIELKIDMPDSLPLTLCDPNQLESAILNLVINARDAMPEGGALTIEASVSHLRSAHSAVQQEIAAGDYVTICISDTGTGMPADVLAQAFDPFFTTKPIGEGTGLGLSMVYGFAKQSEGHVLIDSQVGHGTTVKVYLPPYRGDAAEPVAAPDQNETHRVGAGETVLVVEDEPVVRSLVLEVLGDLGYQPLEAADGPSGLKILESRQRIDLLVTDVGLPGLNGRQMAEYARVMRPDLRVLFITGYAEQAAIASGFLAPGMEMITKPFAIEDLTARIRGIMQRG